MATLKDLGLQEPSTITKNLAVVEVSRNSTNQYQEIMCIGSPNSTTALAIAEVMGTDPHSTTVGMAVKVGRPNLTTVGSTAGDSTSANVVVGSAGSGKIFVHSYSVTSTIAGPVRCGFYSVGGGASSLVWPLIIWGSGGVINLTESVPAPSYLFQASAGSTLTFQTASTGPFTYAVTYSTGV